MLWPWSSIWDENFRQHAKRSHTLVPTPPVPVLLLSLLSSGNRSPVSSRDSCWICGTKVSSFYWDLKSDSKSKDGHLFQMCSFGKYLPPPLCRALLFWCFNPTWNFHFSRWMLYPLPLTPWKVRYFFTWLVTLERPFCWKCCCIILLYKIKMPNMQKLHLKIEWIESYASKNCMLELSFRKWLYYVEILHKPCVRYSLAFFYNYFLNRWTLWKAKLEVQDAQRQHIMTIDGPCCPCSCGSDVEFPVSC